MEKLKSGFHSLTEVNAAECKSRPDKIDSELRNCMISFATTFNEFLRTLIKEGQLREDDPILDENEWSSTVSNKAKGMEENSKNQILELETMKMDEQLNMEEDSIVETPFIEEDGIFKNLVSPTEGSSINMSSTKEVGIGDG